MTPRDYREYETARYGMDHDDEPFIQSFKKELDHARELAARSTDSNEAHQHFDVLGNRLDARLDDIDSAERHQFAKDFLAERERELYGRESEFLKGNHKPEAQLAFRQELNDQMRSTAENFQQHPEYLDRREQLEHRQAARREYIVNEIENGRDKTLGRSQEDIFERTLREEVERKRGLAEERER